MTPTMVFNILPGNRTLNPSANPRGLQLGFNHQLKEVNMAAKTWPTPHWPEGVSHDVSDYAKPLFSVLDESAQAYPNLVYTIFNDATRTYAQVKDTADRGQLLSIPRYQEGGSGGHFSAQSSPLSSHIFWHP